MVNIVFIHATIMVYTYILTYHNNRSLLGMVVGRVELLLLIQFDTRKRRSMVYIADERKKNILPLLLCFILQLENAFQLFLVHIDKVFHCNVIYQCDRLPRRILTFMHDICCCCCASIYQQIDIQTDNKFRLDSRNARRFLVALKDNIESAD